MIWLYFYYRLLLLLIIIYWRMNELIFTMNANDSYMKIKTAEII